ncbi:MAG: NUDIX hydrolase [Leeuwenhoekiella sp.]
MNAILLNQIKKIKSLAEAGLVYNKENYDAERYEELRHIALEMMAMLSQTPVEKLQNFFIPETDYPTPKVDVRGYVLNEKNEFLMVKESVDGGWTLPGGWADIGLTPVENVVKEMQEESGLNVTVKRLLAVFDKKCYPEHPPQTHYVYKLIFHCERTSGDFDPNFDIQDVAWFSLDNLPKLSPDRVVKKQLEILYDIAVNNASPHFE